MAYDTNFLDTTLYPGCQVTFIQVDIDKSICVPRTLVADMIFVQLVLLDNHFIRNFLMLDLTLTNRFVLKEKGA